MNLFRKLTKGIAVVVLGIAFVVGVLFVGIQQSMYYYQFTTKLINDAIESILFNR